MTPSRHLSIWFGAAATAAAIVVGSAGMALGAHQRGAVRSVSNPPVNVPARLRLKVAGSAKTVVVYASPAPRMMKGAVRLGHSLVRHHRVALKVPRGLRAGAWYVVVCPGRSRRGCTASRKQMLKLPTTLSPAVNASPAPETSHASTAAIGSRGGTLNATAADGTRFTLTIAAGSVPDGTQITMTPVSSLGAGSLSSKFVAGVQLAPEGLVLIHGGTLTITPHRSVPVADQLAYGYTGTGDDLHEVPMAPTQAIEIPVYHFSGVGILDAVQGALSGSGSAIIDKYDALIAQEIWLIRNGYISESVGFNDCIVLLQQALSEVMAQEVPPGMNADDPARKAIKDLMTIARASALFSGNESTFEAVKPTIYKLEEGIYNRAQQRCANNHDLTEIPNIISDDRAEALLMGNDGHGLANDLKCLRFKVEIDSQVDFDASKVYSSHSGGYQWHYHASVPIQIDVTKWGQVDQVQGIHGSGPGTFVSASGTDSWSGQAYCNGQPTNGIDTTTVTLTSSNGGTVTVPDFRYQLSGQEITGIRLTLYSSATEKFHYVDNNPCTPTDSSYTSPLWWSDVWETAVAGGYANLESDGQSITIPLDRASGQVIAQKDIPASDGGGYSGVTSIQVIHDPPPP